MSRSGYLDDAGGDWAWICWRGAVSSAIRGKRGQAFIREMADALDAMPTKELHAEVLQQEDGCVCAMGAVASARNLDLTARDPEDHELVARDMDIAHALCCEIAYENDEGGPSRWVGKETPEERWVRMRAWAFTHSNEPKLSLEAANQLAMKASRLASKIPEASRSFERTSLLHQAQCAWALALRLCGMVLDGTP